MAFNAYIVFEDPIIIGESDPTDYKELSGTRPVQMDSYEFATTMAVPALRSDSGAGTSGRGKFESFKFSKRVDTASPILSYHAAAGTVFKLVTVSLYFDTQDSGSSTRTPIRVLEMKMNQAVISETSIKGASGDDLPAEDITLNFGSIEFKYQSVNPETGQAGTKRSQFTWSALKNTGNKA
ncbi:MAG: type VI secretion system tube protein Hcp [Opitutaceae bacterium]|jgi:type VI protein secretion system component Hcp|nr:type VI secretion system tube protein Hcp [Opitutaceae bacterium]